ncbi:hypothetical protein BV898_09771 [Hypsibius exemplaris]|uniref:Receptor ligand binding region domain-containing protein n=1 Tax=Hypsibius exemplaris TaxID=2072580 RepID=A0A1W0WLQ1_HYPEX|nr:hypothetical protein BV898_09771 [Hypsibius exemplaris]
MVGHCLTARKLIALVSAFIVACPDKLQGKINFVTITAGKFSVVSAATVAPAYAIAIEDMSKRYPDIFANHTVIPINVALNFNPGTPDGDWLVVEELVKAYGAGVLQSTDPTIILNSKDNILTLSCGPSKPNPRRYPTNMIVFPGSPFDTGAAVVATMDTFHWKSVAVIWDLCSSLVNAARVEGILRGLLPLLEKRSLDINALVIKMDSTKDAVPFAYYDALWRAGNHSRIVVCGILPRGFRKLMAAAYDIGFTSDNEYVFIYEHILDIPGEHPPEWKQGDNLDLKVRKAFERVLVIRSQPINWTHADTLAERIVQRGSAMFGIPYDPENKFNEIALGCYESVELLSELINRNNLTGQLSDPSAVMQHLKGQTFPLTLRSVTFGPTSARPPVIVLQKFNSSMATFQTISDFDIFSQVWFSNLMHGQLWQPGMIPLDRPVCGIHGERCAAKTSQSTTTIAAVVSIFSAVLATFPLFLYW